MAGRRPLNEVRMKPNGLPAELDDWFLAEGKRLYGKGGGARLKREVLENYRRDTKRATLEGGYINIHGVPAPDSVVEKTPSVLVDGE